MWVILKKVGSMFFKFMANRLDKGRSCSDHLVCDATIILSVKEFQLTIFEF